MTKRKVLDGFKFADAGDAAKLKRWLDDDTMGTPRRKALIIVGPIASGKTTLLRRIAEYKGEKPVFYWEDAPRCGFIPSGLNNQHSFGLQIENRKVILFEDVTMWNSKFYDMLSLLLDGGFKADSGLINLDGCQYYRCSASMAVAVKAGSSERLINKYEKESGMSTLMLVVRLSCE